MYSIFAWNVQNCVAHDAPPDPLVVRGFLPSAIVFPAFGAYSPLAPQTKIPAPLAPQTQNPRTATAAMGVKISSINKGSQNIFISNFVITTLDYLDGGISPRENWYGGLFQWGDFVPIRSRRWNSIPTRGRLRLRETVGGDLLWHQRSLDVPVLNTRSDSVCASLADEVAQ